MTQEDVIKVLEMMTSRDVAKLVARMYRSVYEELIASGFTEDQALTITANYSMKSS